MKLHAVRIKNFGVFTDLELAPRGAPLVVIHGRNEAGKSTLLQFLRQMLFGFDVQNRFAFGDGEMTGVLEGELGDGRAFELRRRKGRKNPVQLKLDGTDTELGESGFKRLLNDPDAKLFESIFAFGLDELRDAEDSLKHDSLRSALFGSGLGGSINPQKLLDDFTRQSEELFNPRGRNPSINARLREINELTKSVRAKSVRADDYEKRVTAREEKEQLAKTLSAELHALRVEHAALERLTKALPLHLQRRGVLAERQQLVLPTNFPTHAANQFETTVEALRRLELEQRELSRELEAKRTQCEGIQVDRALLSLKTQIADCHGLVKSVEEARRDLPKCRAARDLAEQEIHDLLRTSYPDWSIEQLRTHSLDLATRDGLQKLSQLRHELDQELATLQTKQEAAESELSRLADDLALLSEPQDLTVLNALLDRSDVYASDKAALGKEQTSRAKLVRTLEGLRARLSPPLPADAVEALERLPVPPQAAVEQFERELRAVSQQTEAAERSLTEEARRLEAAERELAQVEREQRAVPTLEGLAEERLQRDLGWRLIREHYLEGHDRQAALSEWLGDNRHLETATVAEAYSTSVSRADELADAIYSHADEVARREQLVRQANELRQSVASKQAECERSQAQRGELLGRWHALWASCGFVPLAPEAMRVWLDGFNGYVAQVEAIAHKDIEIADLRQRCADFEAHFRRSLLDARTQEAASEEIDVAIARAKQRVKAAAVEAERLKDLERTQQRQRKALAALAATRADWTTRDANWHQQWSSLLGRLQFPSDWSPELARNVIEKLATAQAKLTHLRELESRIADMEQRLQDFEPQVRQVAQQLSQAIDAERPEQTAKLLHEQWTVAAQLAHQSELLTATIREKQQQLEAKSEQIAQQASRRSALLAAAEVDTDDAFREVADRVKQAAKLDEELARLNRDLELLRGRDAAADFEQRLEASELAELEVRLAEHAVGLDRLEVAANTAREEAGAKRRECEELDGTDEAARLQEDLARQQAAVIEDVHRYVPLIFARQLLQTAMQRFERENQPELIGGISRLFSTMTGGRYVEIERPTSDRDAIYVRRFDEVELSPAQLSTGTREQLYLAIRLAYVRQYCERSEPLPIVMDDVLVNFDERRARATIEALRDVSQDVQVLFFTCHPYCVELMRSVCPDVLTVELNRES